MTYRILSALGAAFGGGAGLAYQHFIGCANGCALKSSPWFMTAFGAMIGLLLAQALAEMFVPMTRPEPVPEKTTEPTSRPR